MAKPVGKGIIGGIVILMAGFLAFLFAVAPRTDEGGIDFTAPMITEGWMAWTLATAIFFVIVFSILITMTVLAINYPEVPRIGVLKIETTRGDRLFISLLGSAFICVAYLAVFGAPVWGGLILCLIWAAAVFRWV